MPRIGIMQGRLVPPVDNRIQAFPAFSWRKEFAIARDLGFDSIEFIFDIDDDKDIATHPLLENGCPSIRELAVGCGVAVETVCGDYFMRHPFHSDDLDDVARSVELLSWLVANCKSLGVKDIVIPCVDRSSLSDAKDGDRLIQRLGAVIPLCEQIGVNLALETDLAPAEFRKLLDLFGSARVMVNYDVGNSASLGYDLLAEWDTYGEKISSVHVKDRTRGGPTVPLGLGSVNFENFFQVARDNGYGGLFVIQGARGKDDVATAREYKKLVEGFVKRFYMGE